ncbi:hypothetical protein QO010_000342 [Caulobacter ginsengisoli]|uniref:DUF2948 domain-containing protein n=1 Tax=Caulobacter ginsengisoli TaxID=400775 RepID=A0ABU0IKQ6_9CAUL|nr:DUF2948 family protein [Caulobacter ginsengisoli]MDQ0462594.1 hypothetical protein [Caulobacter ginsengisoli]
MHKPEPIRLIALDEDDLKLISSMLQDAVTTIGDIRFEAAARRLTVTLNRYRWEAPGERVRCGLQLGGVMSVQSRRLRREARRAVVELLALSFEPGEAPGGTVVFTFAGGGDLRASVECVDAVLADLTAPWPTPRTPGHED